MPTLKLVAEGAATGSPGLAQPVARHSATSLRIIHAIDFHYQPLYARLPYDVWKALSRWERARVTIE